MRSDAVAKHMRLKLNVNIGMPGHGGNRKWKHDHEEPSEEPSHQAPPELHIPAEPGGTPSSDNCLHRVCSPGSSDDGLPSHLTQDLDLATGLIHGQTPAMVIMDGSGGNNDVARDVGSKQTRLPDFAKIAWVW